MKIEVTYIRWGVGAVPMPDAAGRMPQSMVVEVGDATWTWLVEPLDPSCKDGRFVVSSTATISDIVRREEAQGKMALPHYPEPPAVVDVILRAYGAKLGGEGVQPLSFRWKVLQW